MLGGLGFELLRRQRSRGLSDVDEQVLSRPRSWRICGWPLGRAKTSMSPTVPPHFYDGYVAVGGDLRMAVLISL